MENTSSLNFKMISTTNLQPLKIHSHIQSEIRENLRNSLSGGNTGAIFFRRLKKLVPSGKPINITKHITPDVCENLTTLEGISQQEMNKSIEVNYKSFSGFTFSSSVRDDEPLSFDGKEIYVNSKNYAQIDFTNNFTFKFNKTGDLQKPVTPIVGDLLMMYVSNETINKAKYWAPIIRDYKKGARPLPQQNPQHSQKAPEAEMWCIVSDQFLRAWTAIMYDSHETFDKLIGNKNITNPIQREALLRKKLLSGNRVTTNSWLKHKLTLDNINKEMTPKESSERYWHLRTEKASREYVDIYAALVLITRYGEIPCSVNIPVTKVTIDNVEYDRPFWSIPDSLVDRLVCYAFGNLSIKDVDNYYVWAGVCGCTQLLSSELKGEGLFQKAIKVPIVVQNPSNGCALEKNIDSEAQKVIKPLINSFDENTKDKSSELFPAHVGEKWVSIVKGNIKIQKDKNQLKQESILKNTTIQQTTIISTPQKMDSTQLPDNTILITKDESTTVKDVIKDVEEETKNQPLIINTNNEIRSIAKNERNQPEVKVSITVKVKGKWSDVICDGEDEF